MKISFLLPHLQLYGGIRRIIELSNRLVERGHEVTIFHSDGTPCSWMECKAEIKNQGQVLNEEHDVLMTVWAPFCLLLKKAKARLRVFYVLGLYEKWLLKRGIRNQLVLSLSDIYFRATGKISKIPLLRSIYNHLKTILARGKVSYTLNEGKRGEVSSKILAPRASYLRALKKCLHYNWLKLSNSTWMYHWLKDELKIDSQLLIGGINKEIFHPTDITRNSDEIRILYSGDPREGKGSDTILKAIEIVKKQEPRIVLDSYYGKHIPQEEMAYKYSSADIFVDAQWYAGWNNPVAEAMACKVPVVCTDIGGVEDFAFHERTALLVPPKAPQSMASAILRLIRDERLREILRENAYQHIRQFDWDESAKRLEEILSTELKSIDFNLSYLSLRRDILSLIPDNLERVLDIGCSTGTVGEAIKQRSNAEVVGIEIEEQMAEVAKEKLDEVIVGDIEKINLADHFSANCFDCIIFADTLEHLKNPWDVLKNATGLLSDNGVIIASIPNVRHYTTIANLLFRAYWPYRERGIHDKTHLRFFTLKNIRELLRFANLEIVSIKRNYRIIEKPHPLNKYAKYFAFPALRDLLTFQYLIVARKGAD